MRSDHACASARSASRIVSVARFRACSALILADDIRPPHMTSRDFVLFMTRLQRHPESQAMPLGLEAKDRQIIPALCGLGMAFVLATVGTARADDLIGQATVIDSDPRDPRQPHSPLGY
jgi:hypothetical protein